MASVKMSVRLGTMYLLHLVLLLVTLGGFPSTYGIITDARVTQDFKGMNVIEVAIRNARINGGTNQTMNKSKQSWHTKTPQRIEENVFVRRASIGSSSLLSRRSYKKHKKQYMSFLPGDPAQGFSLPTLKGNLTFPGPVVNKTTPMLFYSHDPRSAFSACLWNCSNSIGDLFLNSPNNTHFIFLVSSGDAVQTAEWMFQKMIQELKILVKSHRLTEAQALSQTHRLHFVTKATDSLGNWIPTLLLEWQCQDHNCGIDQVKVTLPSSTSGKTKEKQLILPRLDARYDWLPNPVIAFGNKSLPAVVVKDGCTLSATTKDRVAVVTFNKANCTYAQMMSKMEASHASAVLVMQQDPPFPQDMNCEGTECSMPLSIPATNIPYSSTLAAWIGNFTIQFINEASPNFFAGIDHHGNLAEVGWFLYPTMHFLAWQAQWFNYKSSLSSRLKSPALNVPVFNRTQMKGMAGATVNVTLPPLAELQRYTHLELDLALSCMGENDEACPHWDRTLQLYMCCDRSSPLCGAELGRWISPFRRRIGQWLTNVTPLMPLLTSEVATFGMKDTTHCTFTMKGALPGEVWVPSMNLRFSHRREKGDLYSYKAHMLYNGSFTFDHKYNSHFDNYTFTVPANTKKVEIASVITGHGSDENGCGEFCVTSHHFVVNDNIHNITFDNAGTPLGCANHVPEGVEPNEHGTWLYGRDGWCDGQEVDPWVIDITNDLDLKSSNVIGYFGWFNGRDPDPKHNPGIMAFYVYVTFYQEL